MLLLFVKWFSNVDVERRNELESREWSDSVEWYNDTRNNTELVMTPVQITETDSHNPTPRPSF